MIRWKLTARNHSRSWCCFFTNILALASIPRNKARLEINENMPAYLENSGGSGRHIVKKESVVDKQDLEFEQQIKPK